MYPNDMKAYSEEKNEQNLYTNKFKGKTFILQF